MITQMQEVEYKTNPQTPPSLLGRKPLLVRLLIFRNWRKGPLTNARKLSKRGIPSPREQTVKVTVWRATGQGERAADTALACWDSAESGRLAGQWTKGYRWQRFFKMLLYCQKLARQRGIKFSDVQYSNLRRTYLTFWFVWSLPIL